MERSGAWSWDTVAWIWLAGMLLHYRPQLTPGHLPPDRLLFESWGHLEELNQEHEGMSGEVLNPQLPSAY